MKKLVSLATVIVMCQMQACFTPAFQEVWTSYAQEELAEEYALYQRFLVDRCQQLSVHWQRCCSCSLRGIQIDITPNSMPQYQGISISFFGSTVTFNIGWFKGKPPEYLGIAEFLMSAARPLIKGNWQVEITDGSFLHSSRLRPCVTFLHELTHLILRMDFILSSEEWPPNRIQSEVGAFEYAYQTWVVALLSSIHGDFSSCLSLDPFNDVSNIYQASWGGRDEILVIMGVRLMLEGQSYVLGETMLLRKLAALHGLPTNFVCWSHAVLSFPDSDESPMITLDAPSLHTSLLLFDFHKIAFTTLCHHLGWGEGMEKEIQEDTVATGPIPVFPED
ncbi:MAG: hypothetical protein LBD40_00865 [Puniceicoccales bacterium]|jgi:hypothetical protein|nr:hypothetical protein [Puniceicoccales bacterium]